MTPGVMYGMVRQRGGGVFEWKLLCRELCDLGIGIGN